MSFLNRLILNKQGRLPLVTPRIPGRFEQAMPADPEPGEAAATARTFSRPVVKDSPAPDKSSPPDQESTAKKTMEESTREEGIFSREPVAPENTAFPEPSEKPSRNVPELETGQDEKGHDDAEGILVVRSYLPEPGQPPSHRGEQPGSVETKRPGDQKVKRKQAGPDDQSITVNIGTVEVRAIVEQKEKPRKKSATRKPEMSLQEYLDKKNNHS